LSPFHIYQKEREAKTMQTQTEEKATRGKVNAQRKKP
jgi:hypothetical protein